MPNVPRTWVTTLEWTLQALTKLVRAYQQGVPQQILGCYLQALSCAKLIELIQSERINIRAGITRLASPSSRCGCNHTTLPALSWMAYPKVMAILRAPVICRVGAAPAQRRETAP